MHIVERSKDLLLELGASPILYLMLGLSVISLAVMLERLWFYSTASENLPRLAQRLEERLGAGDLSGAREIVRSRPSIEAAVVAAGIANAERGAEAAREAMASATAMGRSRLERGLFFLGTLGNNAPFVGLLGTVIGIVQAFDRLQHAGLGGSASSEVMGAISEALVATAIGLGVAIPAVAAFNYFQRRIKLTLGNVEALEHLLLSHLSTGALPASFSTRTPNAGRPVRLSLSPLPVPSAASAES